MKVFSDNNLAFRVFVLIVGLSFLVALNFMFFASFLGYKYHFSLVLLTVFLGILLFYLLKYFKYFYSINTNNLSIKTPYKNKVYEIPFSEIKQIKQVHIPLKNKIGLKFDSLNNILYLCGFSDNGILIELKTHSIVIAPRKYDLFYETLKEKV